MDVNFSEDELRALSELGVDDDKIQELRSRMKENRALMNQPTLEGRTAGNIYRAPNWMEYVAQMGNSFAGAYRDRKDRAKMDQILENQRTARQTLMDRLVGNSQPGVPLQNTSGAFLMQPQAQTPSPTDQMSRQALQAEMLRRMQTDQYGGGSV